MQSYKYLAIDVSKLTLQLMTHQGQFLVLNYQDKAKLLPLVDKDTVVVFEATGGYERELKLFLEQRAIAWVMVHPARVRAYAYACGVKAKTDKIDAQIIGQYARKMELAPAPTPRPDSAKLAVLMDRRSQLLGMIKQEKTRLQNCDPLLHVFLKKHLEFLQKEQLKIEQVIDKHLAQNERLQKAFDTICSVDGVGKASAWSILGYLPELADLERNRAVALAGLAPYNRDSGAYKGKRSIHGGRCKLRTTLYMAAVAATEHNAHIAAYYRQLVARGKPAKCALVAVMRKLLLHVRSLLIQLNKQHENMSPNPLAS
jgi:transposase